MEYFFEFLTTYFLGFITYPFYLIYWGIIAPKNFVTWLIFCVIVISILQKYKLRKYLKLFLAVFVFPGTIICGSATVIPWPFSVYTAFSEGDCTPFWALFSSLILNVLIAQFFSRLYKYFNSMRRVKKA
ncbi:hypothetical protein [Sessilibacter corallicola]|uniref:hypothetical protein n=1 Tax=Sessilibacter corallicola TaxID=2904075 RepID=UPI001E2D6563|nr:hypothetical protein [Sessilibacter corallicola]MCE2028695.1 hypothetical protein [Sessilibacter corallicola]